MWKFLEDLKNDFKKGIDDIAHESQSPAEISQTEQEALDKGKDAIKQDTVVALEDGVVEMINQDQNQIEIYFDNGTGYGIKMPFGPAAYTVKVSPNEKVKAGQVLVQFGPEIQNDVKVYAFTPDMIRILSQSRFRIQ